MSKIWITRTRPAADESAKVWRSAGFEPILVPLLAIERVEHEPLPKDTLLIFTSKNGVDHVACHGQSAVCVGDATAEHARRAGFENVISVDGTSGDVTAWVKANVPTGRSIFHVSGWHVRGSIVEDLELAGYSARRVKVYRSVPRSAWPDNAVVAVAFYSPLAAKTFKEIAGGQDLSRSSAICISQATADELVGLPFKSVRIAARPREDELILTAKMA